jgi:hypothetical protein
MKQPGIETQAQRRETCKALAKGRIEQQALRALGVHAGDIGIRIPGRRMPDAAEAAIAGGDLRFENGARGFAEQQVARIRLVLIRGVRRGPCQAHYHRLTQAALRPGVLARGQARRRTLRVRFPPLRAISSRPRLDGSGQAVWFTRRSPFTPRAVRLAGSSVGAFYYREDES